MSSPHYEENLCPLMAPLQPSTLLDGAVNAPSTHCRQETADTKTTISSLKSPWRAKPRPSSDIPICCEMRAGSKSQKARFHSVPKYNNSHLYNHTKHKGSLYFDIKYERSLCFMSRQGGTFVCLPPMCGTHMYY